ncbi:MAG: hypothetical protein V3U24_05055 [Candidatus Neomarinimicrobiota bacterium]
MKIKLVTVALVITSLSRVLAVDTGKLENGVVPEQETTKVIPFLFSFLDSADPTMNPFAELGTHFHLTIISGRVGSVEGLQIGGFVNHVKYDFTGYDATGISSTVEGDYSGYQATGIYSKTKGSFIGIQDVGIYSFVGSDFLGIQTTGITSKVEGSFRGIQVAGISNNTKQLEGLQIAGIVNSADQVNGIQIGLVNLSGELNGLAIGLVNISKAGSVHGVGWSGGAMEMNAGIKFAPNDYWYTIMSLGRGSNFADDEDETSIGYYMGFRFSLPAPSFFAELDIGSNSIYSGDLFDDRDWEDKVSRALETRASLVFRLHNRLSLFAGIVQTRTGDDMGQFTGWETDTSPFFGIQF